MHEPTWSRGGTGSVLSMHPDCEGVDLVQPHHDRQEGGNDGEPWCHSATVCLGLDGINRTRVPRTHRTGGQAASRLSGWIGVIR